MPFDFPICLPINITTNYEKMVEGKFLPGPGPEDHYTRRPGILPYTGSCAQHAWTETDVSNSQEAPPTELE